MNLADPLVLLTISAFLLILALLIMLYRRFPVHLIYKSKIGLEDMLDGISDPLAVISSDFTVRRANRAYTTLVGKSFSDTVGEKCYDLLRKRTSQCKDCRLKKAISENRPVAVARSEHPFENGTISINFSPVVLSLPFFERLISALLRRFSGNGTGTDENETCIIEHIRDITLLEKLKHDLEAKNHSLAHTMKHLKEAQQNIHDELQLARNIQQGLLPTKAPDTPKLKIEHTYHPVEDVGGDIYDFIQYPPNRMGVFIGDASGHGLSAAFVGTISKMSLYNHGQNEIPVAELIARINDDLINNIHSGHYLTCFWGIFDFDAATFTFCRAGHPIPVLIKKDGSVRPLTTSGTFIGLLANSVFEQSSIKFERGDRFFLFTDGIYEVEKPEPTKDNFMLGYDDFVSILVSCRDTPFSKVMAEIRRRLGSYRYDDDYTLIAIEAT